MAIIIKWFPPSWFQIKTENDVIYIDPAYLSTNFKHYPKKIEYSNWPDPIDGLPEELETGDIILITHHHKDHCKKVTVDRLRDKKTKVFAPKQCSKELGEQITVVKPGSKKEMSNLVIKVVEAYNVLNPEKKKTVHKKGNGVGYLISIEGKTIYHAGDTDLIPEMRELKKIDVAMLPIGGRDFTMGFDEAFQAIRIINPDVVIPMHRFETDTVAFKRQVEKETSSTVKVLTTGEPLQL